MRTLDFAPLYRSTVGFDRMISLLDQATRIEPSTTWPPYNIEKVADDAYRITMAVAGFTPDEIDLTQHDTVLQVDGPEGRPGRGARLSPSRDRDSALPADLQPRRPREGHRGQPSTTGC